MGLNVTADEGIKDYLSCEVLLNCTKKRGWIGQPHMIKKIEMKFGEQVQLLRKTGTPGTPGKRIKAKFDLDESLPEKQQSQFRSGIGMLLFLVKHS